jgi:hypothetical protein
MVIGYIQRNWKKKLFIWNRGEINKVTTLRYIIEIIHDNKYYSWKVITKLI